MGDYVIYDEPNIFQKIDARPDKLTSHFKGPYQIIDINTQHIRVMNLLTQKVIKLHPAHVHPYILDPNRTDPADVAQHVTQEYIVDKILKIRKITRGSLKRSRSPKTSPTKNDSLGPNCHYQYSSALFQR